MARRQSSLLAAGIGIGLLLSACSDGPRDNPAPGDHGLRKGDHYVAIGDSYTAAPGTGPAVADDGCLQSTLNYPHRVAKKLGLKLTDVSCTGATTQHVVSPQVLGSVRKPPQVSAVSKTTDLVTISLGGNDFGLVARVGFYCTSMRAKDPAGAPCDQADANAGPDSIERRAAQIEQRLDAVIRLVAKRAPKARIVVVGYPQFFPSTGPCAQLPLAAGDYPLAGRLNERLVDSQRHAAAAAKVDYVDVYAATKGHDMCADEPWIAGAKPTRTDGLFYHPFPEEQRVVADLLVDLLD